MVITITDYKPQLPRHYFYLTHIPLFIILGSAHPCRQPILMTTACMMHTCMYVTCMCDCLCMIHVRMYVTCMCGGVCMIHVCMLHVCVVVYV